MQRTQRKSAAMSHLGLSPAWRTINNGIKVLIGLILAAFAAAQAPNGDSNFLH
jgi:hypothetical protein